MLKVDINGSNRMLWLPKIPHLHSTHDAYNVLHSQSHNQTNYTVALLQMLPGVVVRERIFNAPIFKLEAIASTPTFTFVNALYLLSHYQNQIYFSAYQQKILNMVVTDSKRRKFRPWCNFEKKDNYNLGDGIYQETLNSKSAPAAAVVLMRKT